MSSPQQLPSDQRAVLSLLLRQGKSYAQIAGMLAIDESAVRHRAYEAISSLGAGEGTSLLRANREEIADFLLGQRDSVSEGTGRYLRTLASARTWAEEVRSQLQEISETTLPQIPSAPSPIPEEPVDVDASPSSPVASAAHLEQAPPEARADPPVTARPVSRRGGAVLLAAMLVGVVVAVVLIVNSGGGSSKPTPAAQAPTSTTTSTGTQRIHIDNQLNLNSTQPQSAAKGIVDIASEGTQRAFYIVAEHLLPTNGFFYVAWLYNSQNEAEPIGKAPPVTTNGRLQAVAPLPSDAGRFHQLIVTKETSEHASHPGQVVLKGPFSLGSRGSSSGQGARTESR